MTPAMLFFLRRAQAGLGGVAVLSLILALTGHTLRWGALLFAGVAYVLATMCGGWAYRGARGGWPSC